VKRQCLEHRILHLATCRHRLGHKACRAARGRFLDDTRSTGTRSTGHLSVRKVLGESRHDAVVAESDPGAADVRCSNVRLHATEHAEGNGLLVHAFIIKVGQFAACFVIEVLDILGTIMNWVGVP